METGFRAPKLHREMRKQCRARKRHVLLQLLERAENAAADGRHRDLYRVVRQLSHKQMRASIRLRDSNDQLMSPSQELEALVGYAKQLFDGPLLWVELQPDKLITWLQPAAWEEAFSKLQPAKAVCAGAASQAQYKINAGSLANCACTLATQSILEHCLPVRWTSVQLIWLPRPLKAPTKPKNLRTIGLMSPDTKAFLNILARAIHPFVMSRLVGIPQFGYRSGTSTLDPIARAAAHIARVRKNTATVRPRKEVMACNDIQGGLQIFVDLTKAFDHLPYIHVNSSCLIAHNGGAEHVLMHRGLRQGCPIAPYIFAAWTAVVTREWDEQLGQGWALDHTSWFADDLHGLWEFSTLGELRGSLRQAGRIIECIQSRGMAVSFEKTGLLLHFKGRGTRKAREKLLFTKHQMPHVALCINGATKMVPLQDSLPYLGIVLSCTSIEGSSLAEHIKKAQHNYGRLHQVLRTCSALTLTHRLRIWKACVLSAATYGLCACGLKAKELDKLDRALHQHLRKILRLYRKDVHYSVTQVYNLACIVPPSSMMKQQMEAMLARVQTSPYQTSELKAPALAFLRAHLGQRMEVSSSSLTDVTGIAECIDCTVCGLQFGTQGGFFAHVTLKHPEINQLARTAYNRAVHAAKGQPQCKLCGYLFSSWQLLETHITQGRCVILKQQAGRQTAQVEDASRALIKLTLAKNATFADENLELFHLPVSEALTQITALRGLSHECAICGQKCASTYNITLRP